VDQFTSNIRELEASVAGEASEAPSAPVVQVGHCQGMSEL
jgi:hypothetical protein